MATIKLMIVICLSLFVASGCASFGKSPEATKQTKNAETVYEEPKPEEGSLWVDSGSKLFVDMRARRIGDIVTVRISESPSAKLNATTKTSRDSSIEAGITDLLGYTKALEEKNKISGGSDSRLDRNSMFKASYNPKFQGEGSSLRDGSVVAYVAARVIRLFPNGNLYVEGKREIRVNNETQYINLSGIIRPEDIGPDNSVSSTYIADARIEYSGSGIIADRQRPGWLMRALDYVWPF
ncbi:MAG: flagellar basal body L-ring protein FlgH [Pseudomonadota bacterium]